MQVSKHLFFFLITGLKPEKPSANINNLEKGRVLLLKSAIKQVFKGVNTVYNPLVLLHIRTFSH